MAKLSKRRRAIAERVDPTKAYAIEEAVTLLTELVKTKFSESIDVSVNLGVDPKKSDQVVRGATLARCCHWGRALYDGLDRRRPETEEGTEPAGS